MRLQIKPLPQGITLFTCAVTDKRGEPFGEMDIELEQDIEPAKILSAVRRELPRGLKVSMVFDNFTGEIVWSA